MERGIHPLENSQRLFQVKETFTPSMSGENDEITESLTVQGFDDFSHQIGKSARLDIDRSGQHSSRETIVDRRCHHHTKGLRNLFPHECCISNVRVQGKMKPMLLNNP